MLRAVLDRIRGRRWAFADEFRRLRPGDLVVDCGANTGRYATLVADRGATLYAFEPNPWAFGELEQALGGRPNVHLVQAAVGARSGEARLFLHRDHLEDELAWSAGSSLFASKPNVSGDSVVVEVVGLPAFLESLGRPLTLLKIDVEGSEMELLDALHETGLLASIRTVLVEMHDRKIAELHDEGQRVRRLVAERYPNVRLDWE